MRCSKLDQLALQLVVERQELGRMIDFELSLEEDDSEIDESMRKHTLQP